MDIFVIFTLVAVAVGIGRTLMELRSGGDESPPPREDRDPGELLGDGGIRWRLF